MEGPDATVLMSKVTVRKQANISSVYTLILEQTQEKKSTNDNKPMTVKEKMARQKEKMQQQQQALALGLSGLNGAINPAMPHRPSIAGTGPAVSTSPSGLVHVYMLPPSGDHWQPIVLAEKRHTPPDEFLVVYSRCILSPYPINIPHQHILSTYPITYSS